MSGVLWLRASYDHGFNDAVEVRVVELLSGFDLRFSWLASFPPGLMVQLGTASPQRQRLAEQVARELRLVDATTKVDVVVSQPKQDTGRMAPVSMVATHEPAEAHHPPLRPRPDRA